MKRINVISTVVEGCALAGCAAAVVAPAMAQSAGAANSFTLATDLTGGAVVPGPADSDGDGTARIRFAPEGEGNVCFELAVRNIQPATMAHIHGGTATEVGGPPLVILGTPSASGEANGCASAPQRLVDAIRANPANFFVTIHNAEFPGGALRGQFPG